MHSLDLRHFSNPDSGTLSSDLQGRDKDFVLHYTPMAMDTGDDVAEGSMAMVVGDDVAEGSMAMVAGDDMAEGYMAMVAGDDMTEGYMAMVAGDDMAEGSMEIFTGDDMAEGSGSSLTLNSVEFKQSGDVLSVEDVTWADSCLIKDPELSETNWYSLIDALADALSSPPDTLASSTAERDVSSGGNDIEIFPASEETEPSQRFERTAYATVPTPINEELEKNSDEHLVDDTIDSLASRTKFENAFLPTYKEDGREVDNPEVDNPDADIDSIFPAFVIYPTTEDIFRVWDLDIPAEEDELAKLLEKALSGDTSQTVPSNFDDSGVWEELRGEPVDDLIAGISDLSLSKNSG